MRFEPAFSLLDRKGIALFTVNETHTLFPGESVTGMKKSLARWKRRGWIASLKKGLYEVLYPRDRGLPDLYIANQLYGPSYVSLQTALSAYSLIPEVAQAVTSVTTKPTRRFSNRHGLFLYRTVRPELYCGYQLWTEGGQKVLMAEPEKALADHLYFTYYRRKTMDLKDERIDWKAVRKLDLSRLRRYFRMYGLREEALRAVL